MIGILLAGGAATRLPNKPLLPQHSLQPVCFSGIDYLIRHKAQSIAVITPPSSVLVDIIADQYGHSVPFNFIYQEKPTGVGAAINMVHPQGGVKMIVMADNIYPTDETVQWDSVYKSYAVIRKVPAWRLAHLVRVGFDQHLTATGPGDMALTTPWVIGFNDTSRVLQEPSPWQLFDTSYVVKPGEKWWDVGTPDAYAAYWRTPCKD